MKLKPSKHNIKWLLLSWVVFSILLNLIFSFTPLHRTLLVDVNNKNPDWCGRYDYYLDIQYNTTVECLSECWRLFGCEANATGYLRAGSCICDGLPIKSKAWVDYDLQVPKGYASINGSIYHSGELIGALD